MNAKRIRRFGAACLAVGLGALVAWLPVTGRAVADPSTAPVWTVIISTAPGLPQDVWINGIGNNTDGWHGGGCLCLGPLAQGAGVTMHATVLTDPVAGGVYGLDGTPVAPGTYTLAGGQLLTTGRTGPAEIVPARDYDIVPGETFFMIFDAYVVESNLADLGIPQGLSVKFMFTWDFDPLDPNEYGNRVRHVANWVDFTGTGNFFIPFLNEGQLMTNVKWRR